MQSQPLQILFSKNYSRSAHCAPQIPCPEAIDGFLPQHLQTPEPPADHFRVDACKPGDEGGNFPARIDECMEFIRDLAAIVMVDGDFCNAVMVRVPSCGFYINNRIH